MSQRKPIRVFYSTLSQRFYATRAWREIKPGLIEVTGEQCDVTDDIAGLIKQHDIEFTDAEGLGAAPLGQKACSTDAAPSIRRDDERRAL